MRVASRVALVVAVLAACDRPAAPVAAGPGARPSLATAQAALTISRAELSSGRLRIEGRGAGPNASMLVDGAPLGRADGSGAFRIEASNFSSPTCRVTVTDGVASAQPTLSGCTPTSAPTGGTSGAPPAPSLVAPAAGATLAQPVTLSWSAVTAPTPIIVYDWQVATNATFSTIVAWGQTVYTETAPPPTTAALSGLPDGAYVWRVQAVAKGATIGADPIRGPWSEARPLTIAGTAPGTLPPPTITLPANGAQFHPWEYFDIRWTPVAGAAAYVYEYDDEPSFAYPHTTTGNGVLDASFTGIGGGYGFTTTQYLRVRTVNAAGVRGLPSAHIRFDITYAAPVPPPPALVSPVGGAAVTMPITFDWTSVANEQPGGYELQIAADPNFTGGCGTIDQCVTSITGSKHTVTSFAAVVKPGLKYWRVRSYHGEAAPGTDGPGSGPAAVTAWSPVGTFTLPAVAPSLVALNIEVWGASRVVSTTQAFSGTTGANRAYGKVQLNVGAPAGGTVVTLASSNPAAASVPATITVPQGEAVGIFVIEPLQVTDTTDLTLSATMGAQTVTAPFRVLPAELGGYDVAAGRPAPRTFSGGTTTVGTLLFNGRAPTGSLVTLTSSSPFAAVPTSYSVTEGLPASFDIVTSVVPATTEVTLTATWRGKTVSETMTLHPPPTLLAPAAGAAFAVGQPITFDWNTVDGGFSYEIQIDDASAFTAPLVAQATPAASQSEYTTSILPAGTLYWRVRSRDAYANLGPWSAVRSVTISGSAAPLPAPTLQWPVNDARVSSGSAVVFDWSDVTGAATYTIQVDDSETFSAPLTLERTVGPSFLDGSGLPARRLWWRVRANDLAGRPGAWSAVRRLEVR